VLDSDLLPLTLAGEPSSFTFAVFLVTTQCVSSPVSVQANPFSLLGSSSFLFIFLLSLFLSFPSFSPSSPLDRAQRVECFSGPCGSIGPLPNQIKRRDTNRASISLTFLSLDAPRISPRLVCTLSPVHPSRVTSVKPVCLPSMILRKHPVRKSLSPNHLSHTTILLIFGCYCSSLIAIAFVITASTLDSCRLAVLSSLYH
jgi:hypothetical protein